MNRLELVERVANKHGISKAEADRIVVTIFEEIMSSVTLG
ncbi:MAG: HU family DNA-binding protein, partial [Sutterella sp.]